MEKLLLFSLLFLIIIFVVYLNSKNNKKTTIKKNVIKDNSELKIFNALFIKFNGIYLLTNKGIKYFDSEKITDVDIDLDIENNYKVIANYYKNNEIFLVNDNSNVLFLKTKKQYNLSELYNNYSSNITLKNIINLDKNKILFVYTDNSCKVFNTVNNSYKTVNTFRNFNFDYIVKSPLMNELYIVSDDVYNSFSYNNNLNITFKDKGSVGLYLKNLFKTPLVKLNNFNKMGMERPNEIYSNNIINVNSDGIQEYKIERDSTYVIECCGAGVFNGGKSIPIAVTKKLKKGDTLQCLVGNSGYKLPSIENKFELKNQKLPLQNSCSGAGSSVVLINRKLSIVTGGGGGFSSGLLNPPLNCNNNKSIESTYVFPIKELIFTRDNQINKVKVFNSPNVKYSTRNGKHYILNDIITDYKIILSKNNNARDIQLIDVNNSLLNLKNYNLNHIDNKSIYNHIFGETLGSINNTEPIDNEHASNGFSINESNNIFDMLKKSATIRKKEKIITFGGFGGGGFSSQTLNTNFAHSGGGGGYKGGTSCVNCHNESLLLKNNNNSIIPHTAGSGGTNFVDSNNDLQIELLDHGNRSNGYINIYEMNSNNEIIKPISININNDNNNKTEGIFTRDTELLLLNNDSKKYKIKIVFYPSCVKKYILVSVHGVKNEGEYIKSIYTYPTSFNESKNFKKLVSDKKKLIVDLFEFTDSLYEKRIYKNMEELKFECVCNIDNCSETYILLKNVKDTKYKIDLELLK